MIEAYLGLVRAVYLGWSMATLSQAATVHWEWGTCTLDLLSHGVPSHMWLVPSAQSGASHFRLGDNHCREITFGLESPALP